MASHPDHRPLVLDAAGWLDAAEWRKASDARRLRYLNWVGDRAAFLKKRQIRRGLGSNGKPLPKVKPTSRPDNATGAPLDPHYAESRSVRYLTTSVGPKAGTVKIWWQSGWTRILGYHADGKGRYGKVPVRDVIEFPTSYERELIVAARRFWKGMGRTRTPSAASPARATVAAPAPVSIPLPIAAKPAAKPRTRKPPKLTPEPHRVMSDGDRSRVERSLQPGGQFSGWGRTKPATSGPFVRR